MKYCIIGLPRSRSSILLETISIYYNIKILGEEIGEIKFRENDNYLQILKNLIEENSKELSGVIRLHPLQMCFRSLSQVDSGKPGAFNLLDFKYYNFRQYNKIFFTYRESIEDTIASNFIAFSLGKKYTYKSKSELVTDIKPLVFSKNDYWHATDYIHSIEIMELLKKYLLENNIPWQDLYYNEIPAYLKKHFSGAESFHIETNYNYRKMISNFEEITVAYHTRLNKRD